LAEQAALLKSTLDKVATQFDALLFGTPDAPRATTNGVAWLDSDDAKIDEELANSGFPSGEIAAVTAILEAYRHAAPYRRSMKQGIGAVRHSCRLLKSAAQLPAPPSSCSGASRPGGIGTRSSYLALLKEQPSALDRLIDVCAISGFLSRQIADFPLLLDELIDAKAFDELPSRQDLLWNWRRAPTVVAG